MMSEHRRCLEEFAEDDELYVLVYTGVGRAFCAGIDIKNAGEFLHFGPEKRMKYWVTPNSLKINKPVIAAINGYALGGGFELALGCDIRIAADTAKIGLPEVRLGALPAGGGTQWLPRMIGLGDAFHLMFTGEPVTAEEALRLRMIQQVVPADELMDKAMALAETIARNGQTAIRLVKEVALTGYDMSISEALWLEQVYFQRNGLLAGDEIKELVRKFTEKSKR
jgi:enoyl-CoA hydratase/carnithine racemase